MTPAILAALALAAAVGWIILCAGIADAYDWFEPTVERQETPR